MNIPPAIRPYAATVLNTAPLLVLGACIWGFAAAAVADAHHDAVTPASTQQLAQSIAAAQNWGPVAADCLRQQLHVDPHPTVAQLAMLLQGAEAAQRQLASAQASKFVDAFLAGAPATPGVTYAANRFRNS